MIDYCTLGRKVHTLYPFLAKELVNFPDLTDLGQIEPLYCEYCTIQSEPKTKKDQMHNSIVFIAAILKLYDPDVFEFKKNIKNGLRRELSKVINCEPTGISHSFEIVKKYLSVYPDFRNEVYYIYSELKKHCGVE